jgi:hypothetical protein
VARIAATVEDSYGHSGEDNKDTLKGILRACAKDNADLNADRDIICPRIVKFAPADLCHKIHGANRAYSNAEWIDSYKYGTIQDWVGDVEMMYVDLGGVPTYVPPAEFYGTAIALGELKASAK